MEVSMYLQRVKQQQQKPQSPQPNELQMPQLLNFQKCTFQFCRMELVINLMGVGGGRAGKNVTF